MLTTRPREFFQTTVTAENNQLIIQLNKKAVYNKYTAFLYGKKMFRNALAKPDCIRESPKRFGESAAKRYFI